MLFAWRNGPAANNASTATHATTTTNAPARSSIGTAELTLAALLLWSRLRKSCLSHDLHIIDVDLVDRVARSSKEKVARGRHAIYHGSAHWHLALPKLALLSLPRKPLRTALAWKTLPSLLWRKALSLGGTGALS